MAKSKKSRPSSEVLLPLVGTPLTLHRFLTKNEGSWFTIPELAKNCDLSETSVRTGLTIVALDPRVVRRKRPKEDGRAVDEYSFMSLLSRWTPKA